jgi:hypothetical protein
MTDKKNKQTSNEDQKSELVVQHNHLIEAKYHLTLQEKKTNVLAIFSGQTNR